MGNPHGGMIQMNNEQRERIAQILNDLDSYLNEIEEIKDDEECKYDNLPESLQNSSLGEGIQDAINVLEDAYSYLSDAIDSLNEI